MDHFEKRQNRKSVREGVRDQREFFIENLLVRIHFIIVMIRWTGLAPWEFAFPFPGSLTSTFLNVRDHVSIRDQCTSLSGVAMPSGVENM